MVKAAPELTSRGLPLLTRDTFDQYYREILEAGRSYEEQMAYIESELKRIGRRDESCESLIRELVKHHEGEDWDLSIAELTGTIVLLERSGELPIIRRDRFLDRMDVDIGKGHGINMLNVGKNMPIVEVDNPVLFQYIMGSASQRPYDEMRTHVMADQSLTYLLLLESL